MGPCHLNPHIVREGHTYNGPLGLYGQPTHRFARLAARSARSATLSQLGGMEFVARGVVEGFLMGLHRSPHRVSRRSSRSCAPTRPGTISGTSIGACTAARTVLRKAVRGRDQSACPPAARRQRVDGVELGPRGAAKQAVVRQAPGCVARTHPLAPGRLGGACGVPRHGRGASSSEGRPTWSELAQTESARSDRRTSAEGALRTWRYASDAPG